MAKLNSSFLKDFFIDRRSRVPRCWANGEIEKFAPLFKGDVVNVSAWTDTDKQGRHYRDYFANANSYSITNYRAEARGFQGTKGEIFLDLTEDLDPSLRDRFDVVFNHTVLEHVYEVHKAFANLCAMSRDVVMLVVPFLQPMHSHYGDYWRFSPLALKRMYEDQGLELLYLSFNSHRNSSVYVFAIGAKHPERWDGLIERRFTYVEERPPLDDREPYVGVHAIQNYGYFVRRKLSALYQTVRRRGDAAPERDDVQ